MEIKWWGHACFAITNRQGLRIVVDPYDPKIGYQPITDEADIVTVSHNHFDHNAVDLLSGAPEVVSSPGQHCVRGVHITGIPAFHDSEEGAQRGSNILYHMVIDDWNVVHLGDLGTSLTPEQTAALGEVDLLFVPVGGHFTIDAAVAYEVAEVLQAQIIIPMHYKTSAVDLPIAPVSAFSSLYDSAQVIQLDSPTFSVAERPEKPAVLIFEEVGHRAGL